MNPSGGHGGASGRSGDRIRLIGLTGHGRHGVKPEELRDGQRFVVDVELELDLRLAGRSDDLVDTVDYGQLADAVVARIEGEPVALIERLAHLIACDVLADDRVTAVDVVVHKPQAPLRVSFEDVQVHVHRVRGVPVVIALGANLGDPLETLQDSLIELADVPGLEVTDVSGLIESDPVLPFTGSGRARPQDAAPVPGHPVYLNAVVLGEYVGEPETLLRELHAVEHRHGRTREVHWGPRTLDLDLVQFGVPGAASERLSDDPALRLPHPRAVERPFVLAPWLDADPSAMIRTGATIAAPIRPVAEVLAQLDQSRIRPGPDWSVPW